MRGQATGAIIENFVSDRELSYEVKAVMGRGPLLEAYKGYVAVLLGSNNGVSSPFKVPSREGITERATARLDVCQQPYTEEKGLFRPKLYVVGCPALGSFAVNPTVANQLQNAFQDQVNLTQF